VLGIAVMVTIATHQTDALVATGTAPAVAAVEGFQAAFRVQAIVLAAAGLLALLLRAEPRAATHGATALTGS